MADSNSRLETLRAGWQNRGQQRPSFAISPADGQESVWDYPRPPAIVADSRKVRVLHAGKLLAETEEALRVLETASPPTFYLPLRHVELDKLTRSGEQSFCEWKGSATYWRLTAARQQHPVAWSYEEPFEDFHQIKGHFAFYPGRTECWLGEERVKPQAGGFYGGWITPEIVGPFKGDSGTGGW